MCYINTDSFIVQIKAQNKNKDVGKYFETRFDTSNYELDKPLPREKNHKSNWINEE